ELLIDVIRIETLKKYIRDTPRHCLTYYDITFILEGNGSFVVDEHEFPVTPNHLYFTAPGQIREWNVADIPQGLVLIFEEEFLCSFFSDPLFVKKLSFFRNRKAPPQLSLTSEQREYLSNIMFQVEQEISDNKEVHLLRALLYQALAWLNKAYRSFYQLADKPQSGKTARFAQLVETHFCSEHTVSFYSSELCITSGYLNDLVKNETCISAKQYIINRLMTEARRLLQFSEAPIAEIAWKLGFGDPSYFVRLFRNETGASPLAFRKSKLS
ncbi:MAG TPA: AraC family transcriptional regulator, partial [Marinilabiliales bacterium]|nr:AraC family transcriptional regulator [Marinilabiliales bacterium]